MSAHPYADPQKETRTQLRMANDESDSSAQRRTSRINRSIVSDDRFYASDDIGGTDGLVHPGMSIASGSHLICGSTNQPVNDHSAVALKHDNGMEANRRGFASVHRNHVTGSEGGDHTGTSHSELHLSRLARNIPYQIATSFVQAPFLYHLGTRPESGVLAVECTTGLRRLYLPARKRHRLKDAFISHHRLHVWLSCGVLGVALGYRFRRLIRGIRIHATDLALMGYLLAIRTRVLSRYQTLVSSTIGPIAETRIDGNDKKLLQHGTMQ